MVELKPPEAPPVDGFKIRPKDPLISEFMERASSEEDRRLRELFLKESTIDDDEPDLEKYDDLE